MLAVKLIVEPAHKGELLPTVGAAGVGFTTTEIVEEELPHPITETRTLYVPAMAGVTGDKVGFCTVDVNEFGPLQL